MKDVDGSLLVNHASVARRFRSFCVGLLGGVTEPLGDAIDRHRAQRAVPMHSDAMIPH